MRRYFLLAALAASAWGSSGPIVCVLEMGGNGYLFGGLKISLGLAILAIPLLWQKRCFWQQVKCEWQSHWPMFIASGTCFGLSMLCIFQAFALTNNPTLASAIFYTAPIISSLGAQILRRRLQSRLIIATAISFGGVIIVLVAMNDKFDLAAAGHTSGFIMAMAAALLIASWTLLQSRFPPAQVSDYRLTLYQTSVSAVLLVGVAALGGHWDWGKVAAIAATPHQAGWLLFNATISYWATALYLWSLRRGGAAQVAPASFADAITTPFWAWLVLGTAIVPWAIIGILVTVAGGYLAMREDTPNPNSNPGAANQAAPPP